MSTTLKMSVDKMGFLLDRFSQDCGPLQYVRELTQNSIEAIRRAGRDYGVIEWGYDQAEFDKNGIKKLCITDNGCGMGPEEMLRYLNNLSASGSRQAINANYGIGAKISAYAKNQCGVTYLSFRGNEGNMVQVWKDPSSDDYGLKLIQGQHVAALPIDTIGRFSDIAKFGAGTHVVLHGMTELEDTFSSSKELVGRGPGQWVRRYLNTRYFRLPTNIQISCKTAGGSDEQSRYVTGQEPMLDGISLEHGVAKLTGATAYWWIVPSKNSELPRPVVLGTSPKPITAMSTLSPGYDTTCHLAAIFQDELHDTIRGNPARLLMQQFGVLVGYEQVIIYVEPTDSGVAPNMARTVLTINKEPLPWADWADEFKAKMPKALRDFVEKSQPTKHDGKSEDERIKTVMDLFKVPKFKLDTAGQQGISAPDRPGKSAGKGGSIRPGAGVAGKRVGRVSESAYTEMLDPNGSRGSEVLIHQELPEVVLVSADAPQVASVFGTAIATQTAPRPEDMMPDKAGWFTDPNTINVNLDFGGLRMLVERFVKEYTEGEAVRGIVAAVVISWWNQTLKETVHGIRSLAHSRVWTKEETQIAMRGESGAAILTAAVMPRYLVHQAIKREITGKLGKSKSSKDDA
jgi:hypothetical protein